MIRCTLSAVQSQHKYLMRTSTFEHFQTNPPIRVLPRICHAHNTSLMPQLEARLLIIELAPIDAVTTRAISCTKVPHNSSMCPIALAGQNIEKCCMVALGSCTSDNIPSLAAKPFRYPVKFASLPKSKCETSALCQCVSNHDA